LKAGALVQVTASSLTGRFGQAAERAAFWLLDHRWVHFLATDAHNIESRPPLLRPAFNLVAEQYDLATAERLCIENPRAAFYGEALAAQPELAPPHTVESRHRPAAKTSFFGRLFGR
jgi:protein-tyrosine phosphatase